MNLCINARDAMPKGGRLTISTARNNSDAVVRISDDGFGMDAETRAKAFEPFFTTKPFGKGSGLGLSMVYGFVRQSGGRIEIASEPGKGTTISLYFPRLAFTKFLLRLSRTGCWMVAVSAFSSSRMIL